MGKLYPAMLETGAEHRNPEGYDQVANNRSAREAGGRAKTLRRTPLQLRGTGPADG